MSPLRHQLKEAVESALGIHLWTTRSFPFVHARRRFLTVRMDLNNKCNLRCPMCYFALEDVRQLPAEEMSDRVLERLRREVWPLTQELWLSCAAEPLIAPRLKSALLQAKQSGVPEVVLVTNAVALTEEKAEWLIEAPLDALVVSLDGASAAVYERIRPPADFGRVIGNIERLQTMKRRRRAARPSLRV
ncbi:MAG: radical SAM protein, partial [Candidatus Sumerlaeota bacterium]|nr:radical SAM protein [Candidatus Sumerlaeota bacterium]